jgi:hypothetical protein
MLLAAIFAFGRNQAYAKECVVYGGAGVMMALLAVWNAIAQ